MATLWDLKKNQKATVLSLGELASSKVGHRLVTLGFSPQQEVTLADRLPLEGPICLVTACGEFALDKELALQVLVNPL